MPGPPPGDLPDPEIEPMSLMCPALAGGFFTTGATWESEWPKSLNTHVSKHRRIPKFAVQMQITLI